MSDLLDRYLLTRVRSEALCKPLQTEDYIPQPVEFASPPKWHLAHITWFFEEMILKRFLPEYKVFNDQFGFLFNSYYNTLGARTIRNQRGSITRPGVAEVYQYRHYVDTYMAQLLAENTSEELIALVTLGINHEQQHQELLLTDLKYVFSLNPTFPVYDAQFNLLKDHNSATGWLDIPAGIYEIGHSGNDFCFDNELGRHKVYASDYAISRSLVTNGEYCEFMQAGGYRDFRYWLDEGWAWVCGNKIEAPMYWQQINGEWFYYTLAGLQPVDRDAILCHVSFYEAAAYAAWKGARLPTEAEWEIASAQLDWGKRWEWTYSAYVPYPGFRIAVGAVGEYNGKFMINQMVLRGASVATAKGHSRNTYRNFFHPHYQWQYSGIRLAQATGRNS